MISSHLKLESNYLSWKKHQQILKIRGGFIFIHIGPRFFSRLLFPFFELLINWYTRETFFSFSRVFISTLISHQFHRSLQRQSKISLVIKKVTVAWRFLTSKNFATDMRLKERKKIIPYCLLVIACHPGKYSLKVSHLIR